MREGPSFDRWLSLEQSSVEIASQDKVNSLALVGAVKVKKIRFR